MNESRGWLDRYNKMKSQMEKMLTKIGYKTNKIPFIAVNTEKQDNILTPSSRYMKYQGFDVTVKKKTIHGYTLWDALNTVIKPPKRNNDKPFRMSISWIYNKHIIIGKILQGTIRRNEMVRIYPPNIITKVISIQIHNIDIDIAYAGDIIGIKLDINDNKHNECKPNMKYKRGHLLISLHDPSISICRKFVALVSVQDFV